LHEYSKIPSDEVDEHISTLRDLAWNLHPYPSIGMLLFLDLGVCGDDLPLSGPSSPSDPEAVKYVKLAYASIIKKLQSGGKFLDVGCMFAQDVRKLVYDGAPVDSVYGTDLREDYFEHGYELFKDEAIIPHDHFIKADILDTESLNLKFLERKLDVINSTHVIHIFTYEDQILFLKRMIGMLKDEKGTMIIGRMTGNDESGYHLPQGGAAARVTTKSGSGIWEHNVESFRELWEKVAN
jgi:SAM-dependent methyltransferase